MIQNNTKCDPRNSSIRHILVLTVLILGINPAWCQMEFSFFTELPSDQLETLFNDSSVTSNLSQLKASVRMGIIDFDTKRADVVRGLNNKGIPVVAWILLPEKDGYWFNMENGKAAIERYRELKKWTKENNLHWAGIGIDLEANMDDIVLMTNDFPAAVMRATGRLFSSARLDKARLDYKELVDLIKMDNYTLESYILPFLLDERAASTLSFQRATGILDLPTDTEIPMAYSSFYGPNGMAFIPVYGKGLKAIAIGSTGGGVKIEGMKGTPPLLSWEDLQRDIVLASKVVSQLHIFSLEGCVEKGYLTKIKDIDYNQAPPDISSNIAQLEQTRSKFQKVLVVLNYPILLTLTVILLLVGFLALIIWGFRKIIRVGKTPRGGASKHSGSQILIV